MPNAEEHVKDDAHPDERKGESIRDDPLPQVGVVGYTDSCERDGCRDEFGLERAITYLTIARQIRKWCRVPTSKSSRRDPGG